MWLLDYFAAHKWHMLDFPMYPSDVRTTVMTWVLLVFKSTKSGSIQTPTPEIHPNEYPLVTLSLPVNECTNTYQFPRHQYFKELPDAQIIAQLKLSFKYKSRENYKLNGFRDFEKMTFSHFSSNIMADQCASRLGKYISFYVQSTCLQFTCQKCLFACLLWGKDKN